MDRVDEPVATSHLDTRSIAAKVAELADAPDLGHQRALPG